MKLTFTSIFSASAALLLTLTACERSEPTSYLIPKESRETSLPGAGAEAATAAPAPKGADDGMRVLPGMQEAAKQAGAIHYTVPEGWVEKAPSGIRKANLTLSDANGSAELTVLVFPGDVGGVRANINRWRGQIGLPEASDEDFAEGSQDYTISAHPGLYVRLEGGAESILGALLPFHGSTWFFKLHGDSETVFANEAKLKTFLDSVQIKDDQH